MRARSLFKTRKFILRILFVTSEAHPLIKTGGLADVSGSLPAALRVLDADVRILIPGYPAVLEKLLNVQPLCTVEQLPVVGKAELVIGNMPDTDTPVIAINCPALYEREGGPYINANGFDWEDNPIRFGVLSKIAATLAASNSPLQDWIPDIVHCNDWQSGLTPAYMKLVHPTTAKSVLSVHNLAFQGCYDASLVERLSLPRSSFQVNGLEYYGQLSFLKAGVFYADTLSTVSPTYAEEIQTAEYGFGMQGLLDLRGHEIHGILNGIDINEWNPATDPHLVKRYSNARITGKKAVKEALQQQFELQIDANAPLLGVVSRLTYQKGLDLLIEIAPNLIEQGCQIIILGSGETALENSFKALATTYSNQVGVAIGYNETLSHQIMAGVDLFIMPSRFEPCGLNQLYGLRYGTPPVVTRTGGLADSVTDTNAVTLANNTATGFTMEEVSSGDLMQAITRALDCYKDTKTWRKIQHNAMSTDVSWTHSAQAYLDLYTKTLEK